METPSVEFHVRVRLPDAASFHSSPSGDAEYEAAYSSAISAVKPRGFEVRWPRTGQKWPVDSEGYTWVPLTADQFTPDERARILQMLWDSENQLKKLRESISALA